MDNNIPTYTEPQINLSDTLPIKTLEGDDIWISGHVLRKPKSQTPNEVPTIIPIPIFFDPKTGDILDSSYLLKLGRNILYRPL